MPAPIGLKFAGDILDIIDFPAVGLMEKCLISFNAHAVTGTPIREF